MPVFETAPVVFEIGSALTKIGYAADSHPRFIIQSENFNFVTGKTKNIFDWKTEEELYEQIVEFVQNIFFKYLLVSPKERKVVIVENTLCPTLIRNTLARVLFRHFDVLSILFLPLHLVVLSTLAIDTALVVDIGYREAIVIPVYSGVQVLQAWQAQPLAAEAVHAEIKRQLLLENVAENLLTKDVLEDIKVRLCFVTTYERAQMYRNGTNPPPCPDVKYPIGGQQIITVPGIVRETAFEVIFPEDNDRLGLPYIILDAILKCPIDMRRHLAHNICLIGGTTMATGLAARIRSELLALLESNFYKDKLFFNSVKFHSPPSKANFTAWLGGSIYGSTDMVQMKALTKDSYAKIGRVPDWSNLEDNRCPGTK